LNALHGECPPAFVHGFAAADIERAADIALANPYAALHQFAGRPLKPYVGSGLKVCPVFIRRWYLQARNVAQLPAVSDTGDRDIEDQGAPRSDNDDFS
jgi:hypothetical protein